MYYKQTLQTNFLSLFLFSLLSSLLFNCSNNEVGEYASVKSIFNKEKGMMSFLNYESLKKQIDDLSKLSNEELEFWIANNNPNSLYFNVKENDYLNDLPIAYKAVLNNDSKIIIAEKTVLLNEGILYELNDDVHSTEQNQNKLTQIGSIKISLYELNDLPSSDNNILNRTTIGQNLIESRYQNEFLGYSFVNCLGQYKNTSAKFKYVHELVTVQTRYGMAGDSKIYLRVKLEYNVSGRKWRKAELEPRDINININLSGTYLAFPNGVVIPTYGSDYVNLTFSCSGDRTILLKSSASYDLHYFPNWSVQTTGTITHQFHGGYYHWSNTFIY